MKTLTSAVCSAFAAIVLSGCAGTPSTTAATAANSICPMCSKPVDTSCCTTFEGNQVAFCTTGCQTQWGKLPDADRRTRLSKIIHLRN